MSPTGSHKCIIREHDTLHLVGILYFFIYVIVILIQLTLKFEGITPLLSQAVFEKKEKQREM